MSARSAKPSLAAIDSTLDAKYHALFEQGMLFMGFTDLAGRVLEVNRLALDVCGYRGEEVLGKPFWETGWWRGSPEVQARIREATETALAGGVFRADLPYWWGDGSEHWVDFTMVPITDGTGRIILLSPAGMDITERVRAQNLVAGQREALEMLTAEAPLRDILDYLAQIVERQSAPPLYAVIQRTDEEAVGYVVPADSERTTPTRCAEPAASPPCRQHADAARPEEILYDWTYPILSSHGHTLGFLAGYSSTACTADSFNRELVGIVARIAALAIERQQARDELGARNHQLEHLANFDPLTGLPNRALLLERLDQALAAAARRGRMAAVLFVDLDHFKWINDELGHQAGDELLREVAQQLRAAVRGSDTLGRLGGDEFLVILDTVDTPDDARTVADKLVQTLASTYALGGREFACTASVGIGVYPFDAADAETLIAAADMAMYAVKQGGRNAARAYRPEMTSHKLEAAQIGRELRRALDAGQLTLRYQPVRQLAGGRITGFEALLRWEHPARGLVGADDIIPAAEESGLIVEIGEWVLRRACRDALDWRVATQPVMLAVNVSVLQIKRGNLVDVVRRALADSGFEPARLEIEITENALQYEQESLLCLRELHRMGVRVAIDDFGTGYSCLASIKHLPLHRLKVDRAFVRDVIVDPNDAAIADTIIAMARRLNLQVTAEGVESEAQLDFLRTRGCDAVQGFLLGEPMTAAEVAILLADAKKPG